MKPARAYSDMTLVERDLAAALKVLRDALDPTDGTPVDVALCDVETFAAVALGVMRKTNPSKVRDVARVYEIKARMDGVPVVEVVR